MQDNYQPPAADVSPKFSGDSAEQDLASFVGPNAEYSIERFRQSESGAGASWHWPAFFITSGWLLYRKMWFYAFAYIILLPVTLVIVFALLGLVIGEAVADAVFQIVYLGIACVFVPIIANRLYFHHARRRIAKVHAGTAGSSASSEALAAAGGTNLVAALLLLLVPLAGIVAGISIPAYQDYTIRAQVAEGLSLAAWPKQAVVEFYDSEGELPADNGAAGLPAPVDIAGSYVEAISVEDGVIYIDYGGTANSAIDGLTLYLQPVQGQGQMLEWSCRSDDIADKWLPASCRD